MKPNPLSFLVATFLCGATLWITSCDDTAMLNEARWAEEYEAIAESARNGDFPPTGCDSLTPAQKEIATKDGQRRAKLDGYGTPQEVTTYTYYCPSCNRHWQRIELGAEGFCRVCDTQTQKQERKRGMMRYPDQ